MLPKVGVGWDGPRPRKLRGRLRSTAYANRKLQPHDQRAPLAWAGLWRRRLRNVPRRAATAACNIFHLAQH